MLSVESYPVVYIKIVVLYVMLCSYASAEISSVLTSPLNQSTFASENSDERGTFSSANAIAELFVKQLKAASDRTKGEVHGKNEVAKYLNLNEVEVLSAPYNQPGINHSQIHFPVQHLNQNVLKIKATDHRNPLLPDLYLRNGKSSKHYSDGTGHHTNYTNEKYPTVIISQKLHSRQRASETLDLKNDGLVFVYEVAEDQKDSYFLSVVVEKMSCQYIHNVSDSQARLSIHGAHQDLSICKKFDNSLNKYQTVDFVTSGDSKVEIRTTGNWSGVSASVVVSIYTEASHCMNCPNDHFCCGNKETSCNTNGKQSEKTHRQSAYRTHDYFRCIPKVGQGGSSLMCNGHPNCGFYCNADERSYNCIKDDGDNDSDDGQRTCDGYYCREYQQDRFMITLLLLVLFCIVFPVCIFLFVCGKKDIARRTRATGRCPLPLEIVFCPFSINPEDETENVTRVARSTRDVGAPYRSPRRPGRNTDALRASGAENPTYIEDLPPSYAECCSTKVIFTNGPRPEMIGHLGNENSRRTTNQAPPHTLQLLAGTSADVQSSTRMSLNHYQTSMMTQSTAIGVNVSSSGTNETSH